MAMKDDILIMPFQPEILMYRIVMNWIKEGIPELLILEIELVHKTEQIQQE